MEIIFKNLCLILWWIYIIKLIIIKIIYYLLDGNKHYLTPIYPQKGGRFSSEMTNKNMIFSCLVVIIYSLLNPNIRAYNGNQFLNIK